MAIKKLAVSFSAVFALLLLIPNIPNAQVIIAKADDLLIQNGGLITLTIGPDGVLGLSTMKKLAVPTAPSAPTQKPSKQEATPNTPAPPPTPISIPLVPAHVESTVTITPPTKDDKKIQVTITKTATTPAPSVTAPPANGEGPAQKANTTPTSSINKTVDQVTALGANGQPVLNIKSEQADQLTITQGSTQATTNLPLQINAITHSVTTPSTTEAPVPISVLPAEALQGVTDQGLLKGTDKNRTEVRLAKDYNGIDYMVQGVKKGKLLGILNVETPVTVKLSASNGRIVSVSQSLLFNFFGSLIK